MEPIDEALLEAMRRLGPPDETVSLVNVMDIMLARLADASLRMEDAAGAKETAVLVDLAVETARRLLPEYGTMAAAASSAMGGNSPESLGRADLASQWIRDTVEGRRRAGSSGGAVQGGIRDNAADREKASVVELELVRRRLSGRI